MEKEERKAGIDQPSSTHASTDQTQQSQTQQSLQSSTKLPQHDANEETGTQIADVTAQHEALTSHEFKKDDSSSTRHQVIAVSASKGPAAFFNLARKFLATDEYCDLSALEGAIVSAVDAAHLLERSKLADIVR